MSAVRSSGGLVVNKGWDDDIALTTTGGVDRKAPNITGVSFQLSSLLTFVNFLSKVVGRPNFLSADFQFSSKSASMS